MRLRNLLALSLLYPFLSSGQSATIWNAPQPCSIPSGGSTCTTTINWQATNAPSAGVRLRETNQWVSCSPGVAYDATYINASGYHFDVHLNCLDAGSSVLATLLATGVAPSATIWNSPQPCTIAAGSSSCSTTINWSATNAPSAGVRLRETDQWISCSPGVAYVANFITASGYHFDVHTGCFSAASPVLASIHATGVHVPQPGCSSAAPQSPTTTATSGTFRLYAYNVVNATSVLFPTWGDPGGQDDLVWYPGVNAGSGTWYADVNLGNHKAGNPEYGNFTTHVYANGNTYCAATGFSRPVPVVSNEIPVLVYHIGSFAPTAGANPSCTGYNSDVYALKADLETMHANGFTVVPLRWVLEWALGHRDRASLPAKPVAITFDDGYPQEWHATQRPNPDPSGCPGQNVTSARQVLLDFKNAHQDLPAYSPHATSFVVGSRKARGVHDAGQFMWWLADDGWWAQAKAGSLIDIQNHSSDHDNPAVGNQFVPTYDPGVNGNGFNLAIGGNIDGYWKGEDRDQRNGFCRIGLDASGKTAFDEIVRSADQIAALTNNIRPDIFAAPFGNMSGGLSAWFQNNMALHGHYAAFTSGGDWVSPGQNRFAFKRFTKGCHWNDAATLLDVLRAVRNATTTKTCAASCPP